jgi:hypothetical protein
MQLSQASLVMMDLHTRSPKVYFNGVLVEGYTSIKVLWDDDDCLVTFTFPEDSIYKDMSDSAIRIRRA